jgi:hypothetical protein
VITGTGAADRVDALVADERHGRFDRLTNSFE